MPRFPRSGFALVRQTASEWIDQGVSRMGAALAFYTLFAIAPLFVIVLPIAGLWFGEDAARRELFNYSAQIPFFGAKFTQIYSTTHGSQLEPVPGAKAVTLKEVVSQQPHPVV